MKRVLRVFALGVGLGIVLAFLQRGLHIDQDAFLHSYWLIVLVLLVGALLCNLCYNMVYQRKMRRLAVLLEEGKTADYLAGVEALLQTAKGRGLRNLLQLNLAAGYIEAKQYDRAIGLLEALSSERFVGGAAEMCRRLNLCMSYFYTAQTGKAMALYTESQPVFAPFRDNKVYGGNVAAADVLAAIGNRQYKQAEELLSRAKNTWSAPRLQDAFQEIEHFLDEAEKNG